MRQKKKNGGNSPGRRTENHGWQADNQLRPMPEKRRRKYERNGKKKKKVNTASPIALNAC